jgi:hypothetical protein
MPLPLEAVQNECTRIIEDATHSAKGHFNAAAAWGNVHLILGIPATILAFAAGYKAFADQPEISAILALLSGSMAAVITFLNPEAKSSEHSNAGKGYNRLKNQARIFKEVESPSDTENRLKEQLITLSNLRDELNDCSPAIPRFAYRKAVKDIDNGRAIYDVDKESK